MLVRSDYRLRLTLALGLALGLAQLVRAWTLWTFGVVVLVLASPRSRGTHERRRLLTAIAVVAAIAILVPAPWYAHQLNRYDSALFGQPQPDKPVWSRRPLGFFVGAGLPEVVTAPYRPSFSDTFAPIAYSEAWGDYFGVWRWLPDRGPPSAGVRRELVTMSIVGLPFTLLAAAGLARPSGARRPTARALRRAPARRSPSARRSRRRRLLRDVVPDAGRRHREGIVHAHRGPRLGGMLRLRLRRDLRAIPRFSVVFLVVLAGLLAPLGPVPPCRCPAMTDGDHLTNGGTSRLACGVVAVLVVAQLAGWLVYRSVHEEPSALELTERCLRREKLLPVESISYDPIAARARGGALGTEVEGNGVRVAIAESDDEARELADAYLGDRGAEHREPARRPRARALRLGGVRRGLAHPASDDVRLLVRVTSQPASGS